MAGIDLKAATRVEERAEMRQAADMIVMRVGEKEVGVHRSLVLERQAQRTHTGPRIEQQQMRPTADFQRRGVAAVPHHIRGSDCDAAAHAPEADIKIVNPHSGLLFPASVEGRSAF
jgi:hypothetical protein